jgi:hypothetical protein
VLLCVSLFLAAVAIAVARQDSGRLPVSYESGLDKPAASEEQVAVAELLEAHRNAVDRSWPARTLRYP